MSAFGELGLDQDLCQALDDLGWSLPTPIQNEVIPLILGGGDVMAAAETGSGKTGAFALPLLQVCHEVKRGVMKGGASLSTPPPPPTRIQLNPSDRDTGVAVAPDGASAQSRHESAWAGVRASHGFSQLLANSGPEAMQVADAAGPEPVSRVYYEVLVQDEGLVRVGWGVVSAALELGTDALSFGFGGTGKKSHAGAFLDYGRAYGRGDVVGACLDWDRSEISFRVNGESLGIAFQGEEVASLTRANRSFFPTVSLKNAEVGVNFGARPWRFPPPQGFRGLDGVECTLAADAAEAAAPEPRRPLSKKARSASNAPPPPASLLAVVLEPARELAEQTEGALRSFAAHLAAPALSTVSVIGGLPAAQQRRALAAGPDVLVATPGRLLELLEAGACSLQNVRFFVLDEADRLLDPGSRDTVFKIFQAVPQGRTGVEALQVLLFSATLQNQRVRDEGLRLCRHPLLVDLKGRDVVPETVDHLMLRVDPLADVSWLQSDPPALTDGVHAPDGLKLSPEALHGAGAEACSALLSEATKILKQRLVVRLMDALKMDRVLVFCRSNHDCSQLERFLNALNARAGASAARGAEEEESGRGAPYSCAVCGGERSMDERRAALRAFGAGQVRVLIATDLAARGLHLEGLPFVINATLPDSAEQYVHRVGRVGRADARGLAISLASTRREKVWFSAKGRKPWLAPDAGNTRDVAQGGDTIWYDEPGLVAAIQEHLGAPVAELPPSLDLPPRVRARAQGGAYGHSQAQAADRQAQLERLAALQPTIASLAALEEEAQDRYFELQQRDWTRLVQ